MDPAYFRGVGIGLLIAWVTGTVAYLRLGKKMTDAAFRSIILLEAAVSVLMLVLAAVL